MRTTIQCTRHWIRFWKFRWRKKICTTKKFFQLLGLTNNTFVSYEPDAEALRECARNEGSKASEDLFAYAKKRLRREIDALLVHEELDQSGSIGVQ